ncbi:MAG: energy coupling factor transporter S component ThiW [Lachnospiraceae bacterium]|nr:energy coupling factor transporter S component ThiW [Lachnospiraceae bacterium]
MKDQKSILKLVVLSMLVAIGVLISPILRVEGMCPMAHFINIVCSVFLGPWYSLLCATLIGIIRMATMGIPPLALTGAVFGALASGLLYRISKGRIVFAVLGEIIGTGIVGAIISYPVMTLLWNYENLTVFFYVPSFICGTLIGGSIAFFFVRKLADSGMLARIQAGLGSNVYNDKRTILSTSLTIAAFGPILFVVFMLLPQIFGESEVYNRLAYGALIAFVVLGAAYFVIRKIRKSPESK